MDFRSWDSLIRKLFDPQGLLGIMGHDDKNFHTKDDMKFLEDSL